MPAAVVAGVAIALAAATGIARAGTYVIYNCPSAGNGNAGSWTVFGGPQADKGTCSGGQGDWIGPLGGSMGANSTGGVQISVPAGSAITIEQVKVWWSVPSSTSGATTFALAATNTGNVGMANTPLDRASTPDDFVLPSSSTWFQLADYCSNDDYGNGCTFGAGENADLQLFGAELTLSDSSLPTGAITGGALAATGPVAGTQSLAFNAADGDSGVRLVQLLVDGQVLATNDYLSRCPYQNFTACPTTISDSIFWNTANVANGPHDVALRVTSAGGDTAIFDDHTITVVNPPHTPNGSPACEQARLSLTVNGKDSRAVIRYGHQATVRGTLLCGAAPVIGATLLITGGELDTSISTNLLGRFSFPVPRGPDRTIGFSYRAFADDPSPATTAAAQVAVLPRIHLAISPRNTFNDGTVTWRGRVQGGPYPPGGVTLLVEVKEGRRWQPFDEIVAHHGRFTYRYTFLRTTQPTSYRFRVALPTNGADGYDYRPGGGSNTITVHVS